MMKSLSTNLLLNAYQKEIVLQLEKEFIQLLQQELVRREVHIGEIVNKGIE